MITALWNMGERLSLVISPILWNLFLRWGFSYYIRYRWCDMPLTAATTVRADIYENGRTLICCQMRLTTDELWGYVRILRTVTRGPRRVYGLWITVDNSHASQDVSDSTTVRCRTLLRARSETDTSSTVARCGVAMVTWARQQVQGFGWQYHRVVD